MAPSSMSLVSVPVAEMESVLPASGGLGSKSTRSMIKMSSLASLQKESGFAPGTLSGSSSSASRSWLDVEPLSHTERAAAEEM